MRGDKHFLRCFFHYFMFLKYISLLYIYIAFKYAIFYFLFLVFKNSLICQLIYCSSIVSDSRQQKRRLSNGFSVENDYISKNGNRSPNFSMRKAAGNENIGEKIILFLSFPAYWSLFPPVRSDVQSFFTHFILNILSQLPSFYCICFP